MRGKRGEDWPQTEGGDRTESEIAQMDKNLIKLIRKMVVGGGSIAAMCIQQLGVHKLNRIYCPMIQCACCC